MTSIPLSGPGTDHGADGDKQPSTRVDAPVPGDDAPRSRSRRSVLKAAAASGAGLLSTRIVAAQTGAAPSGQPVNSDRQPQFDVADNATIRSAIAERTIAINALTVRFYANPVRRPATVDARWTIRVNQIRTRRL